MDLVLLIAGGLKLVRPRTTLLVRCHTSTLILHFRCTSIDDEVLSIHESSSYQVLDCISDVSGHTCSVSGMSFYSPPFSSLPLHSWATLVLPGNTAFTQIPRCWRETAMECARPIRPALLDAYPS